MVEHTTEKHNHQKAESKSAQASSCTDKNCPTHAGVKLRGRTFIGTVASDKMTKTVVVSWTRRQYVAKFERYERRLSKISAHNPDCINAKKGDVVKIVETRPLSKTKHFTVTEIVGEATKKEFIKTETLEEEDVKEHVPRKKDQKDSKKEDDE